MAFAQRARDPSAEIFMAQTYTSQQTEDAVRVVTEVVEAPQDDLIGRLGLNPMLFVGQLVNFAIVLVVLWLFAYKPLLKLMKERTERIEGGLKQAKEVEERVKALESEREQVLSEARGEAKKVVDEAREAAEKKREALLLHAKSEVEKVVVGGKKQLEEQKIQMRQEMREDVARLVVKAVKMVAGEAVDEKKATAAAVRAVEEARKD